ncbi:serine/threonine-protein kinase PknK [Nannocystaceae bacterium ST9]
MGRVFEARHVRSGELVALKLLSCSDPGHLARFKREFRALARVEHANLIRLGELRVLSETRAYITMERIRGRPFVDWVRRRTPPGRLPNLLRLQRAMRQLIAGASRLHHEQCVHRDLKPSNVLITDEGRVVILDFGLIREAQSGTPTLTRDGQVLGTPAYMAPEQASREHDVSPASDWYAVGVMLFECLTGARPFDGSAAAIMIAKRTRDAPDPGTMVYGLPEPLRELCVRLLAREAAARPSEGELIAVFGEVSGPLPAALEQPAFVGRARELECLREARREVQASASPVVVRIVGAPGLGKSTLVRHYFRELVDQPEVTSLRCRCLERESLPYKGIDGIVDSLAVLIRRMSEVEAAALQPRQLGALARIFPALAGAWGPRPRTLDAEPKELRRMGGAALREVFQRLADRRQLIVAIDDFQWADIDSARLLLEILGPPDPPAILLILGHTDARGEALELLDRYDAFADIRVDEIQLGPLSRDEAEQLVHALTPGDELGDEQLEQVVRRSEGSPLLVHQLARVDVGVALDDAADRLIVRRVLELPAAQRQLLEQIAVASGPLSRAAIDSLIEASSVDLAALVESGLVRREPLASGEQLECAHARIRELVVAELTPNELSRRHRELAKVLEQHGAEPEAIADHWEQGRRPQHAAHWAEQAARQAASMLAFARAAAAYRRALRALGNLTIGPVDELREQLAEQLIALGEVRDAADLLVELATRAAPERASALRRRVAWLLLEDGRIEEAFPLIGEQLEQVGEALPSERWRIVLGLVRDRAALALRGLEFEPRAEAEIDPDRLARVDTLSTFVTLLSQYGHHPRAALITSALRARLLRLALAAGEPGRVAYSLAHEGLILAASGNTELGDRLVERGRRLLPEPSADSTAALRVRHVEAMLYFMTGRWPRASERIDALVELSEHSASGWLRPQLLARRAQLWLVCGRFNDLRRSLPRELAAMRERGNVYNLSRLVAVDVELCLAEGRLAEAHERLTKFIADCPMTFHTFETIWLQMAEVQVALFRGQLDRARQLTERMLDQARAHQVHRIAMMRLYFENLEARVLAATLVEDPRSRSLRRGLRRAIRALQASDKPMFVGMAASSRALVREAEDDLAGAQRAWHASAHAFEQCGMAARVAAVQMRIPARVGEGHAYFERERVAGWHRFVEVFAASLRDFPDDLASISRASSTDGQPQ